MLYRICGKVINMVVDVIVYMCCVALYVLYPYLTIHMRELGISVEEAAIMSAVTPIVAIIMPPIAGVVADRIGNFKVLYILFWELEKMGRGQGFEAVTYFQMKWLIITSRRVIIPLPRPLNSQII